MTRYERIRGWLVGSIEQYPDICTVECECGHVSVRDREEVPTHICPACGETYTASDERLVGHPDALLVVDGEVRAVEFKTAECAHEWSDDKIYFSATCQKCGAYKPSAELPTGVLAWCVGWLLACALVGGAVTTLCRAIAGAVGL